MKKVIFIIVIALFTITKVSGNVGKTIGTQHAKIEMAIAGN